MLVPLLGLVAGIVLAVVAVLSYRGGRAAGWLPAGFRRPGHVPHLVSGLLLAVALCLGIVGWLLERNLRPARVTLAVVALLLLVFGRGRGGREG